MERILADKQQVIITIPEEDHASLRRRCRGSTTERFIQRTTSSRPVVFFSISFPIIAGYIKWCGSIIFFHFYLSTLS